MTPAPRALVTGWFSFEHGEATAGDLLAGQAARDWLTADGWSVEVATSRAFPDGPCLDEVEPAAVDLLVFTCGPLAGWQVAELLTQFPDTPRIALDVSVTDRGLADRFDTVIARDHDGAAAPDISLAVRPQRLPVVGVIHTHAQPAYGQDRHEAARAVITEALRDYPAAVLDLDTRVDPRGAPEERDPRSSAELESVLARLDAVVTSRLHGLVLSLRNGVPVVAVDVMPGGGKVTDQARVLGWPHCLDIGTLDAAQVRRTLDHCLRPGSGDHAARAAAGAGESLERVRARFTAAARAACHAG